MADQTSNSLAAIPLFKALSPDVLAKLAALMGSTKVKASETVFLAHEPGDTLYVITRGKVRIWLTDADASAVTLSELGDGDFFGEMAVIDGGTRSASASAMADTELAVLRRQDFQEFLVQHPNAALDVIRGIGGRLRQANVMVAQRATRNANVLHERSLSALDRVALAITDKVGSVGFFLLIATWTVLWTGYNLLASTLTVLHWRAFDPFPAFVAYLLISNVIQIMLMPLIMVGQNLQGRHSETRAELDFEINQKAEREVTATLLHLERNTDLLLQLMQHLDCRISDEEMRAIAAERQLSHAVTLANPAAKK